MPDDITGAETEFKGPYGRAHLIPLPDVPEAAESVCSWLLTAPRAHPLWVQYLLPVVRLRDQPGFPPPKRQFDGATHELIVVALNPEHGPYTAGNLLARYMDPGSEQYGNLPFLMPANIAHQIEGTDDEALRLAAYAAWGVTAGVLWPESDWLKAWDESLVKTLAHVRGEAHAS